MAEEFEKFKRFEYRMNSNLVLQREGPGPQQNEPTGEPESLVGRLKYRMGDKISHQPLSTNNKKLARSQSRAELGVKKGESVLDSNITENPTYKPSNRGSAVVYAKLLNIVQSYIGDQDNHVLHEGVDEILTILKGPHQSERVKKKACEQILGNLSDVGYNKIYQTAEGITDFHLKTLDASDNVELETPSGVAVVFDDDEEDANAPNFTREVYEEQEDELSDNEQGPAQLRYLAAKPLDEEEFAVERDVFNLDVSRIDAHWLQRELQKIYSEPTVVVATEKEILQILPVGDMQQCENNLVLILKYENFDFAKLIMKNRWKIYYCTRLGQAQNADLKEAVMEEMRKHDAGNEVLNELETIRLRRNKEREIARNVRKEAASLAAKHKGDEITNPDAYYDNDNEIIQTKQNAEGISDTITPSKQLDLSALGFTDKGHLMANQKVKLPEGSLRTEHKTYDEVTVAPYNKPEEKPNSRKPISSLPAFARPAFTSAKIDYLNAIQSRVFDIAFNKYHHNLLVCAPTGAGKTNIALLTILNLLNEYKSPQGDSFDLSSFKIVYISPMKALVAEQVQNLGQRLSSYGIVVRELTGDVSLTGKQIAETQLIVTTPEKWDIVTRKSGERTYTQLVRLIIFDEIHLLHDSRGPVLEAIVARTLRQIEATQERIRLVGLSATLPNYEDVALFLRVERDKGLFYFGNHYRPVPLKQTYIGIKEKKAIKRYNAMNEITYNKVMENAGVNQVLIFVHSRKETARTAKALRDTALENDTLAKFLKNSAASREILQTETENAQDPNLKELLPYGLAIHHAGMHRNDRKLVEDLYADRHLQVLVSTATLAWGVNLPAHTVIIKGTQVYDPERGEWNELSSLDVMQMMGRGGRPQYDSSGHGIIITNHSNLQFYLSLNNQQLPIESQMLSGVLPDMLNAEIVSGSVRSRSDAATWLTYTYLFIRMCRNPELYGLEEDTLKQDEEYIQYRTDIAHAALVLLEKHNLIKYDRRSGSIQVTALGRVASYYYVKHPTIAIFNENLKPTMGDIELLRLFSLSHEFRCIPVREEEKAEVQKLMERVPIPVKGSVDEPASKINVLLQAYISKLKLEGFALSCDMLYVHQNAARIMRAIFEVALKRGWAYLAYKALNFAKMIDKRMWPCMTPLRQFKGVPEELLRKLEKKDFPWDRYYDLTATEIGELVRVPKLGKILHKLIHQFPKLDLAAYIQPLTRNCLLIELTISIDFQWDPKVHGFAEGFWIFVENGDCDKILHYEFLILTPTAGNDQEFTLTVPISEPLPPNYYIRAVSDRWIHSESLMPVSFKVLLLPERNPPHTELLDLQPLPVSALKHTPTQQLYNTKTFNPIQTQVFSLLYYTNDNALICAPPSSGKTVCLEFAISRMMQQASQTKRAVYLAPYSRTVQMQFQRWNTSLKPLGVSSALLTGDVLTDLKLLEHHELCLCTPAQWEHVSRRWKTRKVLQTISLFIVDNLQLLDNEEVGATLEVCVSRMRFIAAQLPNPFRIVGVACSLANAHDVGDWLGAGSSGLFNFSPSMRPVPLEIAIHGFDLNHREARLMAMAKPVYQAIKLHAHNQPTIIFVSDRKRARVTAIDLRLQAAADDSCFLRCKESSLEEKLEKIKRETSLKETLRGGIGYLHEGVNEEEYEIVKNLFMEGSIQVLVLTYNLSWGLGLTSKLVVIMDTKHFTNQGYVDYAMSDMLQMTGRATTLTEGGVAVLLTQMAKKDFYRQFFFEPLPVESRLDQQIGDHINSEIVLKTIENKQDAVDWITWTFYYRRLTKNPNFYGLQGVSHQHLSDHLSELIENAVESLEQAQCISVENEVNVAPLNLGLVASFYYIRYTTIELFNRSLTATTKRKAMLEIMSSAEELSTIPIRSGEESALRLLAKNLSLKLGDKDNVNEPHAKALILLYAHFARCPISTDLATDQKIVLDLSVRLVQTLVDVVSSNGWLKPELTAMEISQMLVQAMVPSQSPLMQLPHFNSDLVAACKDEKVEDVFDFINLDDKTRKKITKRLSKSEEADLAFACNRYPIISLTFTVEAAGGDSITIDPEASDKPKKLTVPSGASITLTVSIDRDVPEGTEVGRVVAPYFPRAMEEMWWLVVGESDVNSLSSIKRISLAKKKTTEAKLSWTVQKGSHKSYSYTLYLMADSYIGCDQEYQFSLSVK